MIEQKTFNLNDFMTGNVGKYITVQNDLDDYLRVLVYGDSGDGKTTFIGTFPDLLVFDLDNGLKPIAHRNPKAIMLWEYEDPYSILFEVLNLARFKKGAFAAEGALGKTKTIGIDGLTIGGNLFMKKIRGLKTKAGFDEYGELLSKMTSLLDLLKVLPYNVVVTAGTMYDKDEATGAYIGRPNIVGSTRDIINYYFDEVYYLRSESYFDQVEKKSKRKYLAHTQRYSYFPAKTRWNKRKLPEAIENPSYQMYGIT